MRLTFLGGADEVGASGTLIEIAGKRLLVDAGIRISAKSRRTIENDQLPDLRLISEAGGPDYILVTHAHTDHTGALPLVVEQYPHTPVLATAPTIELIRVLQADAQRIMKSRQEAEGELPLFDELAVEHLLNAFQVVAPRQPVRLGDGVIVTYHQAGHIVGAASLVIESAEGVLVMSGDVSMTPQRAVVRAEPPNITADVLVLESTYGGKLHANRQAEEKRLVDTLQNVLERGGKALIPAFALGRAQEVLQILLDQHDRLDAPVYVDGMVRAVCRAYQRFADWLPEATTKAADDADLFFRERIKAVQSLAQREELARSESAAIIVSSSGMLTGGPSAFYARHFADNPRNGIFLTGYQDEEAPGRFLQRALRDYEAGEPVSFKIDGQAVTLRCELGTYSLSAHADEAELVSFAEALGASEVALVHGDPSARQSIAARLRQREKIVKLPTSGQTLDFYIEPRPWRVGAVASGQHAGAVDAAALWEVLQDQAGNYFSARELAQIWSGDTERAGEVSTALTADGLYFAADWQKNNTFRVRTPEQVTRVQQQRAIVSQYPDLAGKLIVLRDSNNRPRVGVVVGVSENGFEARVMNAKGRYYPADALLWVIGDWSIRGVTAELRTLFTEAKGLENDLLTYERRLQLVEQGQPVNPAALLPPPLPPDVSEQTALLAIVLRLAADGAVLHLDPPGLLPKHAFSGEPMEQNLARQVALEAFPPEARLRKVGLDIHRKRLTLLFDFADRALKQYAEDIDNLMDQTGWEVVANRQVNQQALGSALIELLPPEAAIIKGPSFFPDRHAVQADISGLDDPEGFAADYLELTGHRLIIGATPSAAAATETVQAAPPGAQQMEINASFDLIRRALEPFGLKKTSLKQGQIVLTFLTPQIGERHQESIAALAAETGYSLTVHPHPDQNALIQLVSRLARAADWRIQKGPSIHIDRTTIALKLVAEPDAAQLAAIQQVVAEETGYQLVVD